MGEGTRPEAQKVEEGGDSEAARARLGIDIYSLPLFSTSLIAFRTKEKASERRILFRERERERMIGTKSCLVIFDTPGVGEQDGDWVVGIANSIAHIYYELEDNGITVNFASSSAVNPDLDIQALLTAKGSSCSGSASKRTAKSFRRFSQDERACEKVIRSVALDRAALFRGVSFDGICFAGQHYARLVKSVGARKMLQLMYQLGRVVAAFEECNAIFHQAFANTLNDCHENGIKVCDTSHMPEIESHTTNDDDDDTGDDGRQTSSHLLVQPGEEACRDGNVVTASAKQASSLEKGASLLKSAILNEKEEGGGEKRRGRRPWWLPLPIPIGFR